MARRIAENASFSVQYSKKLVHQTSSAGSDWIAEWGGAAPWQASADAMDVIFASADAREGARAFETRAPIWGGE